MSLPSHTLRHRPRPRRHSAIFFLAVMLGVAIVLQILSCALWDNWWPLLTGFIYVLVPMPFLFFGTTGEYAGDNWIDVSKFLTGMTVVFAIGVPIVLSHAHVIDPMALSLAIPSAILMAVTAVLYSYFSENGWGDDDFSYSRW